MYNNIDIELENPSSIEEVLDHLQNGLIKVGKTVQNLKSMSQYLEDYLINMDNLIEKHEKKWHEHLNTHCEQAIVELESLDPKISLSEEEKNKFKREVFDQSETRKQQTERLEKNGIKIPTKASDFSIHLCSIVYDTLNRTMQIEKVKDIYSVVKKLDVVSNKKSARENFIKELTEDFENIRNSIEETSKKISEAEAFPQSEKDRLAKFAKLGLSISAKKLAEKEQEKERLAALETAF